MRPCLPLGFIRTSWRRPYLKETEELFHAVRSVLTDAVANQGTTFRDYRTGTGREGSFQNKLQVYGRKENLA